MRTLRRLRLSWWFPQVVESVAWCLFFVLFWRVLEVYGL